MSQKIINIKNLLCELDVDAILLISEQNRFWLTNFSSSAGYIIITKKEIAVFMDGRYYEIAKETMNKQHFIVNLMDNKKVIEDYINLNNIRSIAVESEYMNLDQFNYISSLVPTCISFPSINLRTRKTDDEIKNIKIATKIICDTIDWLRVNIKPGTTEKEVANIAVFKMMELGAEKPSFDPIVASGINGSFPHHKPTDKVIEEGEFVTVDIGCIYNNYCSDITRTFSIGVPKNKQLVHAYNVVLQAQTYAINAIKPNMLCSDIDKICRDFIENSEFKDYFVHSTGHGVGIEVHELPVISKANDKPLLKNSIITVEPGIYIPNVGGIRIEDMILVDDEPEVLSFYLLK